MAKTVVGLFDNQSHAREALRELENAGFNNSNINFIDRTSGKLSSLLVNARIPQQDADIYTEGVQNGGALIVLQALGDQDAERAADILDRHNVVDISRRGQNYQRMSLDRAAATTNTGTANSNLYTGNDMVVPIVEEELRVVKREVESGGVRVNTRVEEVPVNEQVTLREETVDVHRKPVDRPASEADLNAVQQGTFEVRERAEEAVVDKQARVVEEVHVKKNVEERTQNIQDTVRRTDVNVDQLGSQRTVGTTGHDTHGTTGHDTHGTTGEGTIERGASKLENAAERATNTDLNRDGDVGQRDPRNNY